MNQGWAGGCEVPHVPARAGQFCYKRSLGREQEKKSAKMGILYNLKNFFGKMKTEEWGGQFWVVNLKIGVENFGRQILGCDVMRCIVLKKYFFKITSRVRIRITFSFFE